MGAAVGVHYRAGQPAPAPTVRIPGRGESHSTFTASRAAPALGPGKGHSGRDRQATRRKCRADVACVAKPETILTWYRRLIARKFDGSKRRAYPGRPRVHANVEALIVRMAQENSGWGYDRIVGALANLGHQVSDQTVGNILKRHGIAPAPKRSQKTTWKEFISAHMAVLAGTDFFTVEVLTWRGLVASSVLFSLNLESRGRTLAGITRHPTEAWVAQVARNVVDDPASAVCRCRYLLHDRDAKFCVGFEDVFASEG